VVAQELFGDATDAGPAVEDAAWVEGWQHRAQLLEEFGGISDVDVAEVAISSKYSIIVDLLLLHAIRGTAQ
jgi:hypothetical protein